MVTVGRLAERRLYEAAVRWTANPHRGPTNLVDAACQALVDGLDSAALRELAGLSAHDSFTVVRDLLAKALDELGIPYPGTACALLRSYGLEPSWVANHHGDPELFRVCLQFDDQYQVFVDTRWRARNPDEMARAVCDTLTRPPSTWRAAWHAVEPTVNEPPSIAGRAWRRYRI
jgi:hypothetical protein